MWTARTKHRVLRHVYVRNASVLLNGDGMLRARVIELGSVYRQGLLPSQ